MDVDELIQDVERFEEAIVKVQNDYIKDDATEAEVHAAAVELVDKVSQHTTMSILLTHCNN